ncbi:hypothetical protein BJY52DRAFT_892388 [Lactarius psammicola]|nr:hypothetical protein BJY52DRAFT_892388 [Lactarius psammicola]
MQPRTRNLAVLISLILLAASDLVVAQVNAPGCSVAWKWTFNTLGQNACTVAAYLMSTCNEGAFTINALQPGYWYAGPSSDADRVNLCKCNMVAYNLISACDACQGSTWTTWSEYSFNCTRTLPPATFPNAVPPDTRVPQWALVDNTVRSLIRTFPKPSLASAPLLPQLEGLWNVTKAYIAGDTPEIEPGSLIGTSASGSVSPTSSTSQSGVSSTSSSTASSPSSSSSGSKSNTGAIAGGVAGGVVALAALGGLLFYFLRRRPRPQAPSAAFVIDGATPVMPMKFYNPNDPSTFPEFQSMQTSTVDVHVPIAPYNGGPNGNTPANMQSMRPQGYHGLPTV